MKLFDTLIEKIRTSTSLSTGTSTSLSNHDVVGSVREWFSAQKKSPFMLAVLGLLVVFLVGGIIAIAVSSNAGTGTVRGAKSRQQRSNEPLTFIHPPLPPSESRVQNDYRLFRPRRGEWDTTEAEQWFTPPGGAMLEQLHNSNRSTINNLLEAAP
jgi:hypothetical protein